MSQISDIINPWRAVLLGEPASFRDVIFHVENGGRSSGRRIVTHEYPKRNDPYAEDMGRSVRRFSFSGYLVYRPRKIFETNPLLYDYVVQRKRLYDALEEDDVGTLIHPVFASGGMQAMCERYTMTESRERGGYTQFEMQFVEAGKASNVIGTSINTAGMVNSTADAADKTAVDLMPTDI